MVRRKHRRVKPRLILPVYCSPTDCVFAYVPVFEAHASVNSEFITIALSWRALANAPWMIRAGFEGDFDAAEFLKQRLLANKHRREEEK